MTLTNHRLADEQDAREQDTGEQDCGASQDPNTDPNTGPDSDSHNTGSNIGSGSGLDRSSAPTNPDSEGSVGSPDSTSQTAGSKEAQRT